MKTKIHSCARLFALFCMLSLSVTHAWAIDWASLGTAPENGGRYVIYSPPVNRFMIGNIEAVSENPAEATVYTVTDCNAAQSQYYITFSNGGSESRLQVSSWNEYDYILDQGNGYYRISAGTGSYSDYLEATETEATTSWGSYKGVGVDFVFIPEATYLAQGKHLYYAANAEVNRGGSVKVSLTNPVSDDAAASVTGATAKGFADSQAVTAYFKAIPESGYEFVGWKKSPAGEYVSFDENYSETFDATSTSEASPTTFTMYAYFEKESEFEVELLDKDGNSTTGSFAEMYAAAENGYSIVLHKNIVLGSTPLTIDKNITIDFNNRAFTGTVSNLVTIASGKTVTFADNSSEVAGGVRLSANTNAEVNAVQVNGTLKFYGGVIKSENTSEESDAKVTALTVASSGALELKGGKMDAKANSNAYGVKNEGAATLTMGSINATAATNAYGILANGTTNITWSVAVNATTTTGDNAVGVLIDHASAKATIDGGVITATSAAANAYGIWAKSASEAVKIGGNMAVSANAGTTTTAYAIKENGVAVNVETGRFASNNTQDVIAATAANLKLYGGYYVHEAGLTTYKQAGVTKGTLQDGTKFYTEGYRYILSNGDNPNYVVAVAFGEGFSKKFGSLEDAILYTNNNPDTEMTIRLEVPEYTLPAGNYTIPANATLLIPYMAGQEPQPEVERTFNVDYVKPSVFSRLIVSSGAHIDVLGTVEVGCKQSAKGQQDAANGAPTGPYGYIVLSTGSEIVLASGAEFRAWGFVSGDGSIDVRRGAIVREQFQIYDFKGGTLFTGLKNTANNERVFPVCNYFIQNIESKTKYHPGSKLICSTAFYMSLNVSTNSIQIIGVYNRLEGGDDDIAMFLMNDADNSDDTWVQKYYDVSTDKQVYEINSSARLGSMTLEASGETINSADYDLPLTSNIQIHLLSGEMGISQRTVLLPGAEIVIDKQSTVTIMDNPDITYDGALFLYDAAQWGKYASNGYYAHKVRYIPTLNGSPTVRWSGETGNTTSSPASASINVKGTLKVEGAIYTTAGGANIYSTNEDAGTIQFAAIAGEDANLYHPNTKWKATKCLSSFWGFCLSYGFADDEKPVAVTCTSAQLKNGNGTYTATKGNAAAGDAYCYVDGAWKKLEDDGCMVIDKTDNSNWKYLAKPADYVELKSNTEDANHLYHSADETREFILTYDVNDNCQWWEVEDVEENDDLKHCIHPDNDKYYYYDEDPDYETWREKEFTVTWVTKPYEELEENQGRVVYNVDYKSMPKYLGTNPSRPMNDYYTYDFTGWTPELEPVTDDVVYTAVFRQNDRKYLISFLDADGSVLEEALWKMGEVPICKNQPTPSGKILAWEPTIRAVTGDATYRATYTDEEPSCYEITFVNWDGTTLKKADSETDAVYTVNVGEIPVYDGATPAKPAIADKAFEFDGWTPDVAAVSEAVVYTAKFREKPATYTVTFKRAVGDEGVAIEPAETIQTLENVAYGEMPVCTSAQLPTKTPTAAEYYTVVWTPTIAAVTGNATYTATGFAAHKNTCRLTVSAGANGKVALDGSEDVLSAVYEYGNTATVTATATTAGYRFVRWSDGNTDNPRYVTVNAAITLKAEFAINQYTIAWLDYDDSPLGTTTVNYGETPTHAVPARATAEGYSYTFNGWDPAIVPATADATYTATYTSKQLTYTIRIVLNNGMNDIVYNNMAYGQPVAMGTPVKASAGGVNYTFSHWTNSAGLNIGRTIPNVTNNEIYTAQYETSVTNLVAGNSDAAVTKDLILSDAGMEAMALIIEKDGTVTIPAGASVAVQNFILESDGNKSGQLLGTSSARLTAAHAYFDLTLNTQPRTWYAVAVPWEVDAENGIFIKGGRRLVLGRDFDLVYYNGANRATQGPGAHCWQYVEYETDKTMHPGRAYMMYFAPQIATVRFESKDLTIFNDDIQGVEPHPETTGNDGKDANWNGIGNPKVFHATLAAGGATYGYYLNNGKLDEYLKGEGAPTYKVVSLSAYTAIVGKPLFIQAVNSNPIVATATVAAGAPRRAPEAENYSSVEKAYEVTLHASGSAYEDNIFIQTAEQKEPHYVIGQDLVKAGVNAALPQLWVNRYDTRLAVNTTEAVNGTYDYPLTLNIPQTGEYTINSRMSAGEDPSQNTETLYLTFNGSPVWNLSYGAYTATLEKGTTTEYGLRIIGSNAPQITTGIGNVQTGDVQCTKVLRDGVIYILRGNNTYSIDGQLIK